MAIQHARGSKSKMPKLEQAQFGVTTDTDEVYFGNGRENVKILDQKDKTEINRSLTDLESRISNLDDEGDIDCGTF